MTVSRNGFGYIDGWEKMAKGHNTLNGEIEKLVREGGEFRVNNLVFEGRVACKYSYPGERKVVLKVVIYGDIKLADGSIVDLEELGQGNYKRVVERTG